MRQLTVMRCAEPASGASAGTRKSVRGVDDGRRGGETDQRRVCRGRHADAASLLADFDHDGRVGTNEIQQIKENLHHFFDIDDSGAIDPAEIQTVGVGFGIGTCMCLWMDS
jgi:hypothetical protein